MSEITDDQDRLKAAELILTGKTLESAISALENAKAEGKLPEYLQARIDALASVRSQVNKTLSKPAEKRELTPEHQTLLLPVFEERLAQKPRHYNHPKDIDFSEVKKALEADPAFMYSLAQMENTNGMPDIIAVEDDAFVFADCSIESPNRRDLSYDEAASMAKEFGVVMMTGEIYRAMQDSGKFDPNTYSWLATPADIRESDRALVGNRCVGEVYVDQRDACSHIPFCGWRGTLRVPKA